MSGFLKSQYAKVFLVFSAIVLVLIIILFFLSRATENANSVSEFRTFGSCVDMAEYINRNKRNDPYYPMPLFREEVTDVVFNESSSGAKSADYSATNIQVEGVDEADIVKTDGKYVYVVAQKNLYIFENDNGRLEKQSETTLGDNLTEMFVNNNSVIVFGSNYGSYYGSSGLDRSTTTIYEVDATDVIDPKIVKEIDLQGYYNTSRMINDYVYLIGSASFYDYTGVTAREIDKYLPKYRYNINNSGFSESKTAECNQISYFGENVNSFTTILGFKIGDSDITTKTILGDSSNVYMSTENIYFASVVNIYEDEAPDELYSSNNLIDSKIAPIYRNIIGTNTDVFKLSVDGLNINFASKGQVPGTILNQFSMDEYYDTFRIATTRNSWDGWGDDSDNNLYVLDSNMNKIGQIEGLGKTERIYSVRFIGDRVYMVTFRQTDPFYVIGLNDPTNPELLGELKIPGFSSYLHPISDNLILGVGKDADPENGITEGVKVAVFDVSDVSSPIEKGKLILGERWSNSQVLYDHKAFTFNPKTGLVVIPVEITDYDEGTYISNNTFQGFVGFEVSNSGEINELGRIDMTKDIATSNLYDYRPRSIYIDNVLFGYWNGVFKSVDINSYKEIQTNKISE